MTYKGFRNEHNKIYNFWNASFQNERNIVGQEQINDLISVRVNKNNLFIQKIGKFFTIETNWENMEHISALEERVFYQIVFSPFLEDLIPFLKTEVVHRSLSTIDDNSDLPTGINFQKQTIYQLNDIGILGFKHVTLNTFVKVSSPSTKPIQPYQTKVIVTFINPKEYL